jgi:colanic acid biosynthesis glycosyl transferase WcaI
MRILILTQFFHPEPSSRGLPFARELVRRGHEVEVLTGFPNYPGGKVYPGYKIRPWQRDAIEGIPVHRVALYPAHDRSGLRRFANYASFALNASLLGPFLVRKPDLVYVYHPPATMGLPAMVLRALRGCPFVYDVQDLWPDTVAACGMMNNRSLLAMLGRWCRLVYRRADRLVVLSPGFKSTLVARGFPAEKIEIIHNWADEEQIRPGVRDEGLARRLGMAGRFNVVFAGTMGLAQSLDSVIEAARLCSATVPDVQFVFVGGGIEKARLQEKTRQMQLPNTLFLERQPAESIGSILSMADALLVHLKDDPLFRITIPSKTQAYFAAGRPILMAVGGDAADLVTRADAGMVCPPENPAALATAVRNLRKMGRTQLEAMGANGKMFYDRQLSLRVGVQKFEQVFRGATGHASTVPNDAFFPAQERRAA